MTEKVFGLKAKSFEGTLWLEIQKQKDLIVPVVSLEWLNGFCEKECDTNTFQEKTRFITRLKMAAKRRANEI